MFTFGIRSYDGIMIFRIERWQAGKIGQRLLLDLTSLLSERAGLTKISARATYKVTKRKE